VCAYSEVGLGVGVEWGGVAAGRQHRPPSQDTVAKGRRQPPRRGAHPKRARRLLSPAMVAVLTAFTGSRSWPACVIR
jgi:hypothetical protein